MDKTEDIAASAVAGPSGLQAKTTRREPRARVSSSSSSGSSSSSSSSSTTSSAKSTRKKRLHRHRSHKKRGGRYNRKNSLLYKLSCEVSELRKRFHDDDTNKQVVATPSGSAEGHFVDNVDEISLLDSREYRSLYDCELEDDKSNESHKLKLDIQVKIKEPSVPKTPAS